MTAAPLGRVILFVTVAAVGAIACARDAESHGGEEVYSPDTTFTETAGPWSHLPPGYDTLADQPFNSPLTGLWSLVWNPLGLGGIVLNDSSPFSPPGVMQFSYPAGFQAGESPGTVIIKTGRPRNIFVGTWWKVSTGWQGHASNVNKIQFLFPPDGNGDLYMCFYGTPGGPYELRINLQLVNADTRDWLRPNKSQGLVTIGAWHKIEWLVDEGAPGAANGMVRWWLDGVLVGDYRDIRFPDLPIDNYKVAPTWGGMGGLKTQNDFAWYDHVFLATKR